MTTPYEDGRALGRADARLALTGTGSGRVAIWQRPGHADIPLMLEERRQFLYGYADGLRKTILDSTLRDRIVSALAPVAGETVLLTAARLADILSVPWQDVYAELNSMAPAGLVDRYPIGGSEIRWALAGRVNTAEGGSRP
jgi:hypothetical protein